MSLRLVAELSGETLGGRYQLAGRVAGGAGDLYLGQDLRLGRPVSVKVLQPPLSQNPEVVAEFLAEAGSAARLSHRHILTVYDWGSHEDSIYFMVMEYVPGADLRDLLVASGTLDPEHAIEIMVSVCEALDDAHDRGLIHRGLRPENILVSRFGKVKVSDFGVAAVAAPATAARLQGALRYLAPEQARGEEATPSSDVWTAGAVLGEMLSGRPPSPANGGTIVLEAAPGRAAQTQTVPRPSRFAGGIPEPLDDIVERACALEPADRFSTAGEMADALRRARREPENAEPSMEPVMIELEPERGGAEERREPAGSGVVPMALRRLARAERVRRVPWRRRLLAAVAVLGVLSAGAARGVAALLAPDPVRVPALAGLDVQAAGRRAERAGLVAEVSKRRTHKRIAAGLVIAQTKSGMALEGSSIGLVVSKGPPLMFVPALAGLPLESARARLAEAGMHVGGKARRFSSAPQGTVIAQVPSGGRQLWGGEVVVTVSRGRRPVEMPAAAGMRFGEAKKVLAKAGLDPVPLDAYSNAVAKGDVIRTEPAAGRTVAYGSQVRVYVSLGVEFPEVRLPDVRNLGPEEATDRLESANFRVEIIESCGEGGSLVIDTDPVGGTTVREGTIVALFVC